MANKDTKVIRSRSCDLLQSLIRGGEMTAADVCRELSFEAADLDQLFAGTRTMSIAHQLCFATLLIERVPRLARSGETLRNQALAARAYGEGSTESHNSRPVTWSSLKARRV